MHTFDLVTEPWIPVVLADGTPHEVGLREALADADRIAAVYDPAPVVTLALHRLLLAVLGRVHPLRTTADWQALARRSRIDADALDRYLETWRSRFDLFHPEHPFLQTPGLAPLMETRGRTVAALMHARTLGNNAVLMDHSTDDRPRPVTPATAARWLLATLAYGTGGFMPSDAPGGKEHGKVTPLLAGSATLLTGNSLLDTLRLNHLPGDALPPALRKNPTGDRPSWEQDPPTPYEDRLPRGPLDYLTWRTRRVLLDPTTRSSGPAVERVLVFPGDRLPADLPLADIEPMLSFRTSTKKGTVYPVSLRQHRPTWLDLPALLGMDARPPSTVSFLRGIGGDPMLTGLTVIGVETDAKGAKLYQWSRTDLPLSSELLVDPARQGALARAIETAVSSAPRAPARSVPFWGRLDAHVALLLEGLCSAEESALDTTWDETALAPTPS